MRKNIIDKAVGAILMPYIRIGGHMTFPPPLLSRVRTGGTIIKPRTAKLEVSIQSVTGDALFYRQSTVKADSSKEAEWAAVAFGLEEALREGQTAVGIENNSLALIQALLDPDATLTQPYAREYRREVYGLADKIHWTGLRWVPMPHIADI